MDHLIPLADEAFRVDDEQVVAEGAALQDGVLVWPSVVASEGAMVVLGEPGAGKTSTLENLTAGLPRLVESWKGDADACLWVSGADLTEISYQDELGNYLDALPAAGEIADDAAVLTVVLDQADESPLRPHLPRRLQKSLRGRDTSRVRFLMACRTADYPPAITPVLTEAFRACWCVDLAPLTRSEAVALVDSAQISGEELVSAAESSGAAVLASIPMTLELLVLTYQTDGRLQGTPENLFARGVGRLADDPDPHRLGRTVTTSGPQRLRVAGRVAAWMLLSGRRTVWRGPAFSAAEFDVPGDSLTGGKEQTDAGSYEVTPQVLQETLETALFTAADDNRVALRHSSVAAYLAARYLTDRETTQQQLENLFLVGAPDGGTASIPAPLRETAAWLVALNPTATNWLADADPESLAVHSALVRSDQVRRLTVTRLLERAAQFEVGDTRWDLSRWDLRHPLLADQLAEVLESVSSDDAGEWQVRARVRLAVRLAQETSSAHPRLAVALLRLVEDDAWHQTERRTAARAAFALDVARAVPVLKQALASLVDPSYAETVDPDHELRGTLLTLLWPDHLEVSTMLAALRPPTPQLYGMNAHFLEAMPTVCPEGLLPEVLDWVQRAVLPDPSGVGAGFVFASHHLETRMIDALINRTLRSPHVDQHLDAVAKILVVRLREYDKAQFPDPLQPDDLGTEPPATKALRCNLAGALVREAVRSKVPPREAAWLIVHDWEVPISRRPASGAPEPRGRLLDGADFFWALEETSKAAASKSSEVTSMYGELAACLFPLEDHQAFELAYDEKHPAWPYLSGYYDPIELNSPLAMSLRRNYRADNETWTEAPQFVSELKRLLTQARQGDNDSLWQLLWSLRADLRTGLLGSSSGPVRAWPSSAALEDDLADLPDLAVRYLTTEHDCADSWLEQSHHNKRSWAGYVLLTELDRQDALAQLPKQAWGSWAASILTETLSSYSEASRRVLLRHAANHAPATLARRVAQLVPTALSHGQQPIEVSAVDPRWAAELQVVMEDLLLLLSAWLEVTPAATSWAGKGGSTQRGASVKVPDSDEARDALLRTWRDLLGSLSTCGSKAAEDVVDAALGGNSEKPNVVKAAVQAAHALLATDPEANWGRVRAFTANNAAFGRLVAEACARGDVHKRIQSSLDEQGLTDLYLWLSDLYVSGDERLRLGVHIVSPSDDAQEWRDGLPRELSRRATAEAVHQLRILMDRYPDRLSIAAAHVSATKQYAAASWSQVHLKDVVRVLRDPARRVIRSSADLLEVVHETLEQVGRELPPHGELLWDRVPDSHPGKKPAAATDAEPHSYTWRPKPEAALCAYLAHELTLRLAGHRVAVNREVLIYPTDAYGAGDRTDILIDAQPAIRDDTDRSANGPLKLVIEVKGAWNRELATAQEEQLVGRYLPEARTDVGIYLVGWYPIELWDAKGDWRKTAAKKHQPVTLLSDLQAQAVNLSQTGSIHVRAVVIAIPRPRKGVKL